MADKQYDFKYLPLEGKLPGKSFERQTEDAINDLGDRVITVESEFGDISDLAQLAYDTAVDAQNTADKAQSAADNAQAAADNAQATADSALSQAQAAQETADSKAPVYHASEQTTYGVGDSELYGHVKLSDSAGDLDVDGGTAVTPKALQDAVSTIESEIEGVSTDLEERIAQAQATADDAQAAAEAAQTTADTAQSTAEEAAQSAANAQNAADEAKSAADSAQLTADTALSAANNNSTLIANLSQDVSEMRQYEAVGTVDLNEYFEDYARLYVDADSANAPTDAEKCYVAVDIDSDTEAVRQIATGTESGTVWIRNGVITEPDDEDEGDREVEWGEWSEMGSGGCDCSELTNEEIDTIWNAGAVVVNGNLSYPLTVDGNLQVSGDITSDVQVSGYVICNGAITGSVTEEATLSDYDIIVRDDIIVFGGDVTESNGAIYTTATVTNSANATLTKDLTISTTSDNALACDGGELTATSKLSVSGGDNGVMVNTAGTLTVSGSLTAEGGSYGIDNRGTLTVSGSLTAEGANYGVYTNREMIIESGATVTATGTGDSAYGLFNANYSALTIAGKMDAISAYRGYLNYGISTIEESATVSGTGSSAQGVYAGSSGTMIVNGTVTATTENSSSNGLYITNSGVTFEVNGTVYAYAPESASNIIRNSGTITGTGKVYANDVLYYDGA